MIVGCSSAGDVAHGQIVDDPLSVVVARFERTSLHWAATAIAGVDDSYQAGIRLAGQLPADGLRAVLVYASGVAVNGAALVAGMTEALPVGTPISGGLAGDGSRFERTWVVGDTSVIEHGVTAVGLYGSALLVGHGCESGWQDFGPERTITRAEGNVLFELDGKPALTLYKDYLGQLADQLPGSALLFPLSIRALGDDGPPVIRTILGIDDDMDTMTFAGEMPVGSVGTPHAHEHRPPRDQRRGRCPPGTRHHRPDRPRPWRTGARDLGELRRPPARDGRADRGGGRGGHARPAARLGARRLLLLRRDLAAARLHRWRPAQPDDDPHRPGRGLIGQPCTRSSNDSSASSASPTAKARPPSSWRRCCRRSRARTATSIRSGTSSNAHRTSRAVRWPS